MKKFFIALKDISNYFYIRRKIRKAKNTEKWNDLGLNVDWVGRVWTVINLRQEDVGEDALVKKARVIEKTKPINAFIYEAGIGEIVFPSIEQKSPRSYLIVYSPLFKALTLWRTFVFLFFTTIVIWIGVKFELFTKLFELF